MVIYRSVFLLSKLRSLTIQSRFESSNASEQLQWRRAYMAVVPFGKTRCASEHIGQTLRLAKHIGRNKCCGLANVLAQKDYATVHSPQYSPVAGDGPDLGRNFFLPQWVKHKKEIRKLEKNMDRVLSEELKRQKRLRSSKEPVVGVKSYDDENPLANRTASESVVGRLSSRKEGIGSEVLRHPKSEGYDVKPIAKQPPTSQSVSGPLKPSSPEEARIAPLLARADLLVTRDIEWVNLVAGIEQENRYNIVDVCYPSSPVGFIREQSNLIVRQLLRSRRPFVAHILDALGNELFRVRRPFWWINSTIYAEINGKEIGVVHRRWHLWRRIYDLYLGNKQFAVVENPGFWDWTFTLKDIDGAVLAQIDRNWRGFGFELFTDAGQYVIKFGHAESSSVPIEGMPELTVKRSLSLSERAVVVALAVSLDNDYFSVHGGWHLPFMYVGE